jgi:hypothetical protein
MKDRRKTLYCGPKHRLVPTLGILADCLLNIEKEANNIDMLNYAGLARSIAIFSRTAQAEVDKLIMIENRELNGEA